MTKKVKKEIPLEKKIRERFPKIFNQIKTAKKNNLMLVLETTNMKSKSYEDIGMIAKYATTQGVEVRIAPDNSLEEDEK